MFIVINLPLTNSNHNDDLVVFMMCRRHAAVEPSAWSINLYMLQFASFTQAAENNTSFLVTVLERRIQFHALQSTTVKETKSSSERERIRPESSKILTSLIG